MGLPSYEFVVATLGLVMLVMACIEVGSNDAANLVNAVTGAQIMNRQRAVQVAGMFVVLGAGLSSPVMDTVRKGIFDPTSLPVLSVMHVFITTYLVNTTLLYGYSAFGLPISTTATFVFSLAGAAMGVAKTPEIIHTSTLLRVISAIFVSVVLAGGLAFVAQRVFSTVLGQGCQRERRTWTHGPWIAGLMLTAQAWFMFAKGVSGWARVTEVRTQIHSWLGGGMWTLPLILWVFFSALVWLVLRCGGRRSTTFLFHTTSVAGMVCMAIAFGQNDLANCASPGLGVWMLYHKGAAGGQMDLPPWMLYGCGVLLVLGMHTERANRVTRSELSTGSQAEMVPLYAPSWCLRLAKRLFTPPPAREAATQACAPSRDLAAGAHYDPLRASVMLAMSASVIALASNLGLPISTTYVCFATVVCTGWGERLFAHSLDAQRKMARAIWIFITWNAGAALAFVISTCVAWTLDAAGRSGLVVCLTLSLLLRRVFRIHGDRHDAAYQQ